MNTLNSDSSVIPLSPWRLCRNDGGDGGSTVEPLELRVFICSGIGARVDMIVVMRGKCMNVLAEMLRSKASSVDPLSPDHDERSSVLPV